AELRDLDGCPACRRNLQHARVVKGMQTRIELRIGPNFLQFGRTDTVLIGGVFDVHRALDWRDDACPLIRLAITGPDDVEDLFEGLTALTPALNDLDPIEVTGGRIFHRPNNEGRRFAHGRRQITTHP